MQTENGSAQQLDAAALSPVELRRRRLALGLSQAELAAALGVATNTLARWERAELKVGNPRQIHRGLERLEQRAAKPSRASRQRRASAWTTRIETRLPAELSTFIPREQPEADLQRLVCRSRLVTVTGPGGIGKTRLALRLASHLSPQFSDGAAFVSLASIRDPDLVIPAIASNLRVPDAAARSPLESVCRALGDKNLLLLLDNFEQVMPSAISVVRLLTECPRLHVLATSRASLRVSGEHVFRLEPMRRSEAIHLFVERARAARTDFQLTETNSPIVTEICRRLDRLPLAVELAAQVPTLSPEAILSRLDRSLELLTDSPRDAPQRQSTLRAAIGWSYDLLENEEQAVFRRAGVFSGGFTLEAAQSICSIDCSEASLSVLQSLVQQGLVESDHRNPELRFALLETIREFALEQLQAHGELTIMRERHRRFFKELVEEIGGEDRIWSGSGPADLARLDVEQPNVRSALRWYVDAGDQDSALAMVEALVFFWYYRAQYTEGRRWIAELLEKTQTNTQRLARGKLLWAAAWLGFRQGDLVEARTQIDEAVEIARQFEDRLLVARTLTISSVIHASQGEYAAARVDAECTLDLWRSLDKPARVVGELTHLAEYAWSEGDYARSYAVGHEALALVRELGLSRRLTYVLLTLGRAALGLGKTSAAREHLQLGLAECHRTGGHWVVGFMLEALARVALVDGNHMEALELFRQSTEAAARIQDRRGLISDLEGIAELCILDRQSAQALRLAGAAARLRETTGAGDYRPLQRKELLTHLKMLQSTLGADRARKLLATGAALRLDQAITLALQTTINTDNRANSRRQQLSRRQLEVAELVARGLTNLQISNQLVLTERTVEHHVSDILDRLSVQSRVQVAAWVLERTDSGRSTGRELGVSLGGSTGNS